MLSSILIISCFSLFPPKKPTVTHYSVAMTFHILGLITSLHIKASLWILNSLMSFTFLMHDHFKTTICMHFKKKKPLSSWLLSHGVVHKQIFEWRLPNTKITISEVKRAHYLRKA